MIRTKRNISSFKDGVSNRLSLFSIMLSVLLVSAAMKKGDEILIGEVSFELPHGTIVNFVQAYSATLTVVSLLVLGGILAKYAFANVPQIRTSGKLALLAFVIAIAISFSVDIAFGIKNVVGAIIFFTLYLVVQVKATAGGRAQTIREINFAIIGYGIFIVLSNYLDVRSGFGYLLDGSRLYGSSSHPNFLALQIACAVPFLFLDCLKGRNVWRVITGSMLLISLFLLMQTGSRTGLIVAGSAFLCLFLMNLGLSWYAAVLLPGLTVFTAFTFLNLLDLSSVGEFYNRGQESDTRAAAWAEMIRLIGNSPLFGYGAPTSSSENSFLRAWVAYGLFYLIPFAILILSLPFRLARLAIHVDRSSNAIPVACTVTGLVIGSVFEGYFVDSFSVPIIVLSLATAVSDLASSDFLSRSAQDDAIATASRFY